MSQLHTRHKVLFLDVDGVLNSEGSFATAVANGWSTLGELAWDRDAVENVKCVLNVTGARICWSSTWRLKMSHLIGCAKAVGLPQSRWRTPRINDEAAFTPRGREIAQWMIGKRVERYCIVDDDSDMLPEQLPYFVQTSMKTAFTAEHARRAVEILGAK